MLEALRRHPVPMQAEFEHCLVLAYALPADVLQPLLPRGLEVDKHGDLGFVAVALVQTRAMRPAGLPAWAGQSFFLAGYRVFSRFRTQGGRTLRGLRILRSDTDRRRMQVAGNLLTHYNYHHCQAEVDAGPDRLGVRVTTSDGVGDLDVRADLRGTDALPAGSPFASVREARKFAGPLPFTFDAEPATRSIVVIEGKRSNWTPRLVTADVRKVSFLEQPPFAEARPRLASAFHVHGIPYRWERGVREPIPPEAA